MADPKEGEGARRALRIRSGAVARLHKEIGLYEAEAAKEAAKAARMRAEGACPHDVKQQARVLRCVAPPQASPPRRTRCRARAR